MLYDYYGSPVAGGTFPALIWGRFMGEALAPTPDREWEEPTDWVEWEYFRGEYQYSSGALDGYEYDPSDEDSDD
jgi:hypothetical protein